MKNKNKVFMVMLVFSIAVVMSGCDTVEKAKESIDNYDSYSPNMDEGDKYNAYVDLLNVLSDELAEIKNSYAEYHMDEAGNFVPTDNEDANSFTGSITLVQLAIEKADKGLSTKPKMDVDEDVEALLAVLKKEMSILEEIESYYKEKDFLNDHDAKGKELYLKLVSIYKQADEPIKNFSDKMEVLMSETEKKERETHEKEGNKISLGMLQFIDAAKEARDIVDKSIDNDLITENYDDIEGIDEGVSINLTTEKYAELNTKVSKALDELKEVPKDSKAIEKEGFSSNTAEGNIDDFVEKASNFKSVSNKLSASLGDKESLIDAMTVKGISDAYSELIKVYNKIE